MAFMCRRMRWTYQEYMAQPVWFVNLLVGLMAEEAKQQNKATK